jgi:UDP-N-acetylglucosamine 2-epimerase (non-hydrolysing)
VTRPAAHRLLSVVGARPNFMKLGPLARVLAQRADVEHVIVHTGQHYDPEMSDSFFRDLGIRAPDHNLEVGSGSHAQQTAAIMQRFEGVCLERKPQMVLVYGDVNSTVAAALVAAKLGIKVAHVEAGLRSRDWTMPEEINRVVTDRLSDLLFAPSRDAVANLLAEGTPAERIHVVGNIMIDALVRNLPAAAQLAAPAARGVAKGAYTVVTLHRPANVDDPSTLTELLTALKLLANDGPVLFPVHPRTRARIEALGWTDASNGLRLLEPLAYLEMLGLVREAGLVVTDSGGLQEETTFLGVPCVTVRPNTERPITCTHGTNRLVAPHRDAIVDAARAARARAVTAGAIERWDGRTAERIAAVVCDGARFD